MSKRDKQDMITQAGYAVIGLAAAVGLTAAVGWGSDKAVQRLNAGAAVRVSEACNRLQAIPGAVVVVRDGTGTNFMGDTMPVDAACWAKGSDGQWRQTNAIVGPIADLYPKRLMEALGK